MSAIERLARQAANRDAGLAVVAQGLEKDDRLAAAWLIGSLGNGSADRLSDVDIVVVIGDRHAEAVLADSLQEVTRFGKPVWLRDVAGNAPPGGAYVSAGFESAPLPIAVDWYWQPLRQPLFPSDARLLFDKAGVEPSDPPATFAELMSRPDSRAGTDPGRVAPSVADRVALFWAMVPVAAKYSVRGWNERARRILRGLEEQVDAVGASAAGNRADHAAASPLSKLRLLIDQMDHFMPTSRSRGLSPPDTSYAHAFTQLAEDLNGEGWSSGRWPGPIRG